MLKSLLLLTLCWLCARWIESLRDRHMAEYRDSFLRFNAITCPEDEHDIAANFAREAHIPGTPGYRLAKAGFTLAPSDFNPALHS